MAISVMITGGTGFVGSAIVSAIEQKHPEWNLSVLDLKISSHSRPNTRYEIGDVTKPADVEKIISSVQPVAIIHSAGLVPELASRYNRNDRDRIFAVNVAGTGNILTAAKRLGVEAVVWTGSCTAVTDDVRFEYRNIDESWPTSSRSLIYGESKASRPTLATEKCSDFRQAAAEALVLAANDEKLATCALRPSAQRLPVEILIWKLPIVIFGPGDNQLLPSLYACIAKRETPFIIGDGINLWDVTYVSNVADAHVLAVENLLSSKTAAGQAIFISNEQPVPFRDFCLAVWREVGHLPPFELHVPKSVAAFAGDEQLGRGVDLVVKWNFDDAE